jgi:5-methylcytosine-specific restriction enzyme A
MPDTPSRNPTWVWDELVLACDMVVQNGWRGLEPKDPRVTKLSSLLQTLPLHAPSGRLPDFRNPNGVARKSFDIATAHPDYPGVATHGGATDKRVIAEFLTRPAEMQAEAAALRAAATRGDFAGLSNPVGDEDDDLAASEGRLLIRRHVARERDPRLRRRKIEAVLREGGSVTCETCGFDFAETYGDRGRGYIECHHIVPLHTTTGPRTTRPNDLALLCANCHRMIHARPPWLTPQELRSLLVDRGRLASSG